MLSLEKNDVNIKKNHYDYIDVYRVLDMFGVKDYLIANAIEVLLSNNPMTTSEESAKKAITLLERFVEIKQDSKPKISYVESQVWGQ